VPAIAPCCSQHADFRQEVAQAREAAAEFMAHESLDIIDDSRNDWVDRETASGNTVRVVDHEHIARSKARVDYRRWLMSKWAPADYGDHDCSHRRAPLVSVLSPEVLRFRVVARYSAATA
jgi:hypothetical protein